MAKYINADEFVADLDTIGYPVSEFATDDYIDGFCDGVSAAMKELEATPNEDVVSVKHGQWVYDPNRMDFGLGAWQCSICTTINYNLPCDPNINPYNFAGSKYCPHCGARTDGETK